MTPSRGTRLGQYEVVELLGAGGMGEVWRARDTRLGRTVALKVLPARFAESPARLQLLEREARLLAALNHPHIATLYGFEESDGTPALVMELVEGATLSARLQKGPLPLAEALEIGGQIAEALEAAHEKGILHRDLKPANVRLTLKGRVKLLDFGLARALAPALEGPPGHPPSTMTTAEAPGSPPTGVAGTAPYMSPEQARGAGLDRRSDVWALGCVLYEMLTGQRAFPGRTFTETVAAVLEREPDWAALPPATPPGVVTLLERCLRKDRDQRLRDAGDARLELAEQLRRWRDRERPDTGRRTPYPGLKAFTEEDAAVFFGREDEVEALWARLLERHLLCVIGPSGAGKTSFLRAGVIPARPAGWGAAYATPGTNPGLGFARALTRELAGSPDAMGELLGGVADLAQTGESQRLVSVAKSWRQRHAQALLVVDQLEELFTLNPRDTQVRFATLLGRLATEADVHVVVSLRDDFLMRCHEHQPLAPVFAEVTPLGPPRIDGLRRAVTEPASRAGYRFEDDALVDEVIGAVRDTRAALPLLAFAVSQLWERRDRQKGVLGREAYREIGGVEGALARHAETTLEQIGPDRQPLVREVFRNLATSSGTRAVMDRDELLSAFPDRGVAAEVLQRLVTARLLTSYESEEGQGLNRHRVEIVHESLLKTWPRLVRWQAQDEQGALLRDQLRQAAHLWDEKRRAAELLWTGTAYREFELWRERYAGALTALENDFARAMTRRARRRRRVRAAVIASVMVALAGVAISVGVSRSRAIAAAQRAEASKLLALAQVELQPDPTRALALTTASLELADSPEARAMTLRALSEAPPAWEVSPGWADVRLPAFSPDGRHLAVAGHSSLVDVWSEDGGPPLRLPGHETSPRRSNLAAWASPDLVVTGLFGRVSRLRVWSVPGGAQRRTIDFEMPSGWQVAPGRLLVETPEGGSDERFPGGGLLRSWTLPDGEPVVLGRVDARKLGLTSSLFQPDGRGWLYTKGPTTHLVPLPVGQPGGRVLSRHAADVQLYGFPGRPDLLALHDDTGENRLLAFPEVGPPVTTILPKPASAPESVLAEASARWFSGVPWKDGKLRLWDRAALPGARPLELRREGSWYFAGFDLDPAGRVVVASTHELSRLTFWTLPSRWPSVIDGYKTNVRPVAFSPDGRWLATSWGDNRLRLWPLPGTGSAEARVLGSPPASLWTSIACDPKSRYLFAVGNNDNAWIVPLDGSPARQLHAYSRETLLYGAAISPTGRRVATAYGYGAGPKTLRVWDVETGAVRLFDLPEPSPPPGTPVPPPTGYEAGVTSLAFTDDATLYTAGHGGVRRWNLETGAQQAILPCGVDESAHLQMGRSGGRLVFCRHTLTGWARNVCGVIELSSGAMRPLDGIGENPSPDVAMEGALVAVGGRDGLVRLQSLAGQDWHWLSGHVGELDRVAISPDLRWVASTGVDHTLRLWPMPDLSKPPLQTLPHEALVARLKSLTNLRAVRDPKSSTGWTIELGPFPGWKKLPQS